jgi:hypothetical protein
LAAARVCSSCARSASAWAMAKRLAMRHLPMRTTLLRVRAWASFAQRGPAHVAYFPTRQWCPRRVGLPSSRSACVTADSFGSQRNVNARALTRKRFASRRWTTFLIASGHSPLICSINFSPRYGKEGYRALTNSAANSGFSPVLFARGADAASPEAQGTEKPFGSGTRTVVAGGQDSTI